MQINGNTFLVTGGSSGLGLATVRRLPGKATEGLVDTIPFPGRMGRPAEFAQLVQSIILPRSQIWIPRAEIAGLREEKLATRQ